MRLFLIAVFSFLSLLTIGHIAAGIDGIKAQLAAQAARQVP